MKTILSKLTIITLLAALGGHAIAAPDAKTDAQSLNARWADQAFSALPPEVSRNQLIVIHNDDPANAQMKLNQSVTGQPLRLADKTYARGFGLNAKVVMRVVLTQPAQRLLADIGVDRNADGQVASVRFRVSADGKEVFVSDVLRPGSLESIDVPLDGAKTLDLTVDDGGDGRTWDQANWCDPRVVLTDGTTLALEELAEKGGPVAGIPFSFVYGGKPSAELLPQWSAAQKEEAVDATTRRRTLTFTDPQTGLEVKAVADVYLDTPGVDWTVHFTNTGTKDTPILEKVRAVDVAIETPRQAAASKKAPVDAAKDAAPSVTGSDPVLHRLRGSFGGPVYDLGEFAPLDDSLPAGAKISWGSVDNRPSFHAFPFFTLDWSDGGVVTAIGWTGQWEAAVERDGSHLRLHAGMRDLHVKLHPGETIRSPRVLQVYWNGGDQFVGGNLFRQTMLTRIMPRLDGKAVFPPFAYATSSSEMNKTTEANERSYIESFKGLGFECYWLDAWWVKGGHPKGLGHWGFPITRGYDPVRFPNGVKPLRDLARRYGLDFLLWFAPEEIWPGTDLAKERPEWVMKPLPGPIDLTNPEALDYMTRYLNTVIKEWGIDWWRTDGSPGLDRWKAGDTDPARAGMTELRYVEGYYALWDALRAANPRLKLDNCAGGGRRIDLETSARSLALWRTDSAVLTLARNAIDDTAILSQVSNHGLNRYIPFSQSGSIGATPYYFRSGFNGGITFCEDVRPADYPRELLKQGIAEGKRLRKYLLGDFYPLTKPTVSAEAWCAYQYHRPDQDDGVVFAFRRHESPCCAYQLNLRGIDPAADYEVTEARTYTPDKPRRMKGAELQRYRANIDELPGSLLLEYKKCRQPKNKTTEK